MRNRPFVVILVVIVLVLIAAFVFTRGDKLTNASDSMHHNTDPQ